MIGAMTTTTSEAQAPNEQWREAGEAWGSRALDWSCLWEHYSTDVLLAVLPRLGIESGSELLDVACGSGFAVRLTTAMGASVSGIDASSVLIDIARARTPEADLRVGSMYDLPWLDRSFDVALSMNAIWGGCESALVEAHRVLRRGGRLMITFWGVGPPLDLRGCLKVFALASPERHLASMLTLNNIAKPGVAEAMLAGAGFEVVERGSRVSVLEWPDADVAWRAISSLGPAVPSLRTGDTKAIKRDVMAALEHCRDDRGVYRFRNDLQFLIARKP
jgi:SAM-dependent methyltransferase